MVVACFQIFHVQRCQRLIGALLCFRAAQTVVHGAEDHIIQHGRHEHLVVRILKNIAERAAYRREIFPRDGLAVDRNAPGIGDQAKRSLHERRFSRAVRADQPDLLAVRNGKGQLLQNGRLAIGDADVIEYQHSLPPYTSSPPSSTDRSQILAASMSAGTASAYGHEAAEPFARAA